MTPTHQTDQSLPWPARVQTEIAGADLTLTKNAQRKHPNVRWWWNQRTMGFTHGAWCYLCERHLATWSRRFPVTIAAVGEVMSHRQMHLTELERQR